MHLSLRFPSHHRSYKWSLLAIAFAPFLLVSACISQSNTSAAPAPQPDGDSTPHPRMYFSDRTRIGEPFAKDPSVVAFRHAYYMYYSLPPGKKPYVNDPRKMVWGIGIARSTNLYDWQKVGEILPEQTPEMKGIAAPGARVIGDHIELFYQTYDPANYRSSSICHASSRDGIRFTKDATNPVYRPEHMAWSAGRAIDAEVVVQGSALRMYFATRDPDMKIQMLALAEAPLNSGFHRGAWHDVSTSGPVLKPELPWEGLCIEAPTIVTRDGRLYLFYAGNYNNQPQQIGAAESTDGIHWTRLSSAPLLRNGESGNWNASESGHPGALQVGNRYYLFYQGNNDHGRSYFLSMVPISWKDNVPSLTDTIGNR